jgi:hypothetical protein
MNPKLMLTLKISGAVLGALGLLGTGAIGQKAYNSSGSAQITIKQEPCKCNCKVELPDIKIIRGRLAD